MKDRRWIALCAIGLVVLAMLNLPDAASRRVKGAVRDGISPLQAGLRGGVRETRDVVRYVRGLGDLALENRALTEEIREALQEPVSAIVEAIRITLERCPPELSSDLVDRGIVLAGGTSQLRGMDKLLAEQTGLPVHVAEDPLSAVAEGTGVVLHELNFLRKVSSGA